MGYFQGVTLVDASGNAFGCIRDTLTGWVFGPTFDSRRDADEFIQWLHGNYKIEPNAINGEDLRREVERYRGELQPIKCTELQLNHAVKLTWDIACVRQVAVIRKHYVQPNEVEAEKWAKGEPTPLRHTIEPQDFVAVRYLCANATFADEIINGQAEQLAQDGSFVVPATHVRTIASHGVKLFVKGGQLSFEYVYPYEESAKTFIWQQYGGGQGKFDASFMVPDAHELYQLENEADSELCNPTRSECDAQVIGTDEPARLVSEATLPLTKYETEGFNPEGITLKGYFSPQYPPLTHQTHDLTEPVSPTVNPVEGGSDTISAPLADPQTRPSGEGVGGFGVTETGEDSPPF